MIKTLSPYFTTAKTAEIMSRYRPIAPRPEASLSSADESASMSEKIKQSPYLRNLWPQLQARPTRTRKRGRAVMSPPNVRRQRTHVLGLSSPSHAISSARHLGQQGFNHGIPRFPLPNLIAVNSSLEVPLTAPSNLVTLPLLPCPPSIPGAENKAPVSELDCMEQGGEKVIDLNNVVEIPEEMDLLQQLQEPPASNVIAPQPVRPVSSSISVGSISEDPRLALPVQVPKKPEEVEEEVESDILPAVISDSNNKVRVANSAYKEMVGQPECSWLDAMVCSHRRCSSSACKRICGEVTLRLSDSRFPAASNDFSCWVQIEWGSEGKMRSVNAFCNVIRLSCESKDYLFIWRFHTQNREGCRPSTNIVTPYSSLEPFHLKLSAYNLASERGVWRFLICSYI